MKYVNKIENDIKDGIIKIDSELIKKSWNDIMKRWERICPDCKKIIGHKSKSAWINGTKYNCFCKSCCQRGERSHFYGKKYICSEETRKKLSNAMKGKKLSKETKEKIRIARSKQIFTIETRKKLSEACKKRKGEKRSEETKRKISLSKTGSKNPFWGKFGKDHPASKNCGEKHHLYKKHPSQETIIKMSVAKIGKTRKFTNEHKRKMRISAIKRMENINLNGTQLIPSYNINACKYFSNLNENIQHAENGGEFHLKELGYFADGYDPKTNTWYEWDEKHHYYVDGSLRKKDIIRQNEIIKYLKCNFIRIKESEMKSISI